MSENNQNAGTLAAINVDAKISFDDLVNVFVARHEDQLYKMRSDIQAEVKALNKEFDDLKQSIKTTAITTVESHFGGQTIHGAAILEFRVTAHDINDVVIERRKVRVDVEQKIKLVDINGVDWREPSYNYDKVTKSVTLELEVDFLAEQVTKLTDLQTKIAAKRNDLLTMNGEIQAIDRKTRQIKGMLAEMKMEQLGMQDLLQNNNIAKLVQLPNLG